uniref:Tic22-like family protein n=1 Tax=Rhizophora mucronata TaxID=61149 RepID=A0A2P2MNB8_RHIMU
MNNRVTEIFLRSKQPQQPNPHEALLAALQNQCACFVQRLSQNPLFNFNPSSFQTHVEASLRSIQSQTKYAIDAAVSRFNPSTSASSFSSRNPVWARIPSNNDTHLRASGALSNEVIEERLGGIPVYALSNPNEEFVLISGVSSGKSVGLICFKKEDAEALLDQMKTMDPTMGKAGSKVVAIALNKVFQLKVNGVAFRLIPDCSQVKNALLEWERAGITDDGFTGVPVFQSKSLVLRSQNKSYRPVFFRKEDLDKSLQRASHQQRKMNPSFKQGDIQVWLCILRSFMGLISFL